MYKFYYYHNASEGGKLVIEIKPGIIPDKVIQNDDVVSLYKGEELVGYEILNFSKVVKIHCEGEIPEPAKELIEVINHMLRNANVKPLEEN